MIINTGARTDIPAFFSDWFLNRINEGFVCVRNPYYHEQITRYSLFPDVVDCLLFCTKNPRPLLPRLNELDAFKSYWFMTITAYGRDIEPHVPLIDEAINDFQVLSRKFGAARLCWRYDPIFIHGDYDFKRHLEVFSKIASALSGYTDSCVISFINLYEKTKRNFPGIRAVTPEEKKLFAQQLSQIARQNDIVLKTCAEAMDLSSFGVNTTGCLAKPVIEKAIGYGLKNTSEKANRTTCGCYPSRDIGAYNTCLHGCRYCYANDDQRIVKENWERHDPLSPLLIGHIREQDVVREAVQVCSADKQAMLF